MARVSFDSGVLIALDRGDEAAWAWFRRAVERRQPPLVSAAAVAEAWRDGRTQPRLARVLRACDLQDVTDTLARTAGEALAEVKGADTVDALIAASAATEGTLLLTGDQDDMRSLAEGHFRALRVAVLSPR
jgi:predicted nucleic acid-binding protein